MPYDRDDVLMTEGALDNPAKFLHETGLLYKINRDVLHPLGIALYYGEVDDEPSGGIGVVIEQERQPFEFDPVRVKDAEERLTKFYADIEGALKKAQGGRQLRVVNP